MNLNRLTVSSLPVKNAGSLNVQSDTVMAYHHASGNVMRLYSFIGDDRESGGTARFYRWIAIHTPFGIPHDAHKVAYTNITDAVRAYVGSCSIFSAYCISPDAVREMISRVVRHGKLKELV